MGCTIRLKADSRNPAVRQWGKVSAGVGGVQQAILRCHDALTRRLVAAEILDLAPRLWVVEATKLVLAGDRAALDVFHASGPRSLALYAALSASSRYSVLYLHAPAASNEDAPQRDAFDRAQRWALGVADEVWVTNSLLADSVAELGLEASIVSPLSPLPMDSVPHQRSTRQETLQLVVAAYRAAELYGADIAVTASRILRDRGRDVALTVLLYGGLKSADSTVLDVIRSGEDEGWLTVAQNLDPAATRRVVAESDVLLRPTRSDGDSLLVREALADGVRVIASPCCPRPPGCELASRNPSAFAEAVHSGGEIASGEGLGQPLIDVVVKALGRVCR